jgi:hypothetical protein
MTFKEWLNLSEVGTSTGSVAPFLMTLFSSPVQRMYPEPLTIDLAEKKNKKKNRS